MLSNKVAFKKTFLLSSYNGFTLKWAPYCTRRLRSCHDAPLNKATPSRAVLVGHKAPYFSAEAVQDGEFVKLSLDDYKVYLRLNFLEYDLSEASCRGSMSCLYFFRLLSLLSGNPTELKSFSARHAEFKQANAELLGISVDSKYVHLAWVQMGFEEGGLGNLNFPLVSDLNRQISSDYNVLNNEGVALRGIYIIDQQGIVQYMTVNNLSVGRSVDETLRTLLAIQKCKLNPDMVCPVNWKPGDDAIMQLH